jgi:Tfp pilus assembly protein PilN
MIEINLRPGARKKQKSSRGPSLNIGAIFAGIGERFKDPWLVIAIAGVVVGVLGIGAQFELHRRAQNTLLEREQVAVQDSARFAAVLAQRRAAEAQRDSVLRQIAVIRAIDGDRFIWPHLMDEVARALPTYTWLGSMIQTSAATPVSPEAAAAGQVPRLGLRIIGYTADIQAVTIFMKNLEASPFLENVTLGPTEAAVTDGKAVTQFTISMQYSKPDPSLLNTVALDLAVR